MSINAAMIQAMVDKGLSGQDIADIFAASERKKDNTSAERQARYRAKRKEGKSRRNSNAVTPPIEEDHTPCGLSPNGENHIAPDRLEPFPKPDFCDDDQVWTDFLANRKRKRLPNTATAHKALLDDIERISDAEWPPGRLLKHAAAKGWGGIYDPRNDNRSAANDRQHPSIPRPTTRQLGERVAARFAGASGGAADGLPRLGAPGGNDR